MSLTTCAVRFTKRPDRAIYMTRSLMKQLHLNGTHPVKLSLGSYMTQTPVKLIKQKGQQLYLPASIRHSIKLPKAGTLLISSDSDSREVRIGPLIGILTTALHGSMPFGSRTSFFKEVIRVGDNRAYFFVFTPRDVNWQEDTVNGYFLEPTGLWTRKIVPLPDAIYNRLPSRKLEKSLTMQYFKERLLRKNIPIFNWSFFDKGDVYQLLKGDEVEKYVPESYMSPNAKLIKDMMEKHRFVYLKPNSGSLGNGIYRLTYHSGRGYFARFRHNGKNILLRFHKFEGLMSLLRTQLGGMRNYVVQQGIRLIDLDNLPIDFRFHLNKNGKNQWIVSGIGAKKAGRGSVTTHVKNGGVILTPEEVLEKIYGTRAETILSNLKAAATKLAEGIERNYAYRLGELGLDIGLDTNESIWMFEANAKPGRSIFKHPLLKEQGTEALQTMLEYCLFLSSFRRRD